MVDENPDWNIGSFKLFCFSSLMTNRYSAKKKKKEKISKGYRKFQSSLIYHNNIQNTQNNLVKRLSIIKAFAKLIRYSLFLFDSFNTKLIRYSLFLFDSFNTELIKMLVGFRWT